MVAFVMRRSATGVMSVVSVVVLPPFGSGFGDWTVAVLSTWLPATASTWAVTLTVAVSPTSSS